MLKHIYLKCMTQVAIIIEPRIQGATAVYYIGVCKLFIHSRSEMLA